jgi:aquaporin Z
VSPLLPRQLLAEFVGTALLVLVGVGSAVAGLRTGGPIVVALAFGLVLLALAYALGPVSGCHVNPAVTLGVLLSRGISLTAAAGYWAAQFAGGIAGAALLKLLVSNFGKVTDQTGSLGANNYGTTISLGGAFVLEGLLTFVFVTVILLVTGRAAAPGFAGLAIGLALGAVHLVAIPLTGTSVNPARSLGPALFAGGEPLRHVWLFILAPLAGAALAAVVAPLITVPRVRQEAAPEITPADALPLDTTRAAAPSGDGTVPPARDPAHDAVVPTATERPPRE